MDHIISTIEVHLSLLRTLNSSEELNISAQHHGFAIEIKNNLDPVHDNMELKRLEEDDGKCPICQDELKLNELVYDISCKHKIHSHCILLNINKGNTLCPICRLEVL